MKKVIKKILIATFIVTTFVHLLPFDTCFTWNRPTAYKGNTLLYHHNQLIQEGFVFLGKIKNPYYDAYEYIYKRRGFLGREQYIGLERNANEDKICIATKYSPSIYSDTVGICSSIELSDDLPCDMTVLISDFARYRAEITEDESFLLHR